MKKTIAILLILVIGMVGGFAADVPGAADGIITDDNTAPNAKILLNATVDNFTYFGVSKVALDSSDFVSSTAFKTKVYTSIDFTSEISSFDNSAGLEVGLISGITNRQSKTTLTVGVSNFMDASWDGSGTYAGYTIELDVASAKEIDIPAATATALGTLSSTSIKIKATNSAQVLAAPAISYSATVTIGVKAQ